MKNIDSEKNIILRNKKEKYLEKKKINGKNMTNIIRESNACTNKMTTIWIKKNLERKKRKNKNMKI